MKRAACFATGFLKEAKETAEAILAWPPHRCRSVCAAYPTPGRASSEALGLDGVRSEPMIGTLIGTCGFRSAVSIHVSIERGKGDGAGGSSAAAVSVPFGLRGLPHAGPRFQRSTRAGWRAIGTHDRNPDRNLGFDRRCRSTFRSLRFELRKRAGCLQELLVRGKGDGRSGSSAAAASVLFGLLLTNRASGWIGSVAAHSHGCTAPQAKRKIDSTRGASCQEMHRDDEASLTLPLMRWPVQKQHAWLAAFVAPRGGREEQHCPMSLRWEQRRF